MTQIGRKTFLSYRGQDYESARQFAQNLKESNTCENIVLVPPGRISKSNEILLPFEYFELMELITDLMHDCDSFLLLDTGEYWNSYWTQMEVQQWRRFSKDLNVHVAKVNLNGMPEISDRYELEPLTKNQAKLFAKLSVGTNRRMQQSSPVPSAWGKFAKNCFLIPCFSCGRHFLASQKSVYASIKKTFKMSCPHCNIESVFDEGKDQGNFYRKPVLLRNHGNHSPSLNDEELMNLLISNEIPPSIGLITLPDEKLDSDLVKILKMYGWVAVGAVAIGATVWLFEKLFDKDDNKGEE